MPVPNEIVVGPAEVWVAPVATAFPNVGTAPPSPWVLIGTAGSDNYGEDGVVLRRTLTMNYIRTLGSTAARKAAISETSFEVEFNVLDLNPEELAYGYGTDPAGNTVITAAAGPPVISAGIRFDISTNPVPLELAVLVRVNQSPLGNAINSQWQIYQAVQAGQGEGTFSKEEAFSQGHLWVALKDSSGNFVRFVAQSA